MDIDMGGQSGNQSTNPEYTRTSKSRVHWAVDWRGEKELAKKCGICGRILSTRYSDKDGKTEFCCHCGDVEKEKK
jgi:hypothetical protein